MIQQTFEAFKTLKLKEGFDEVLIREWAPNFANDPHDHPFDTEAVVAQGEYWLTMNGKTTHYKTGDLFKVSRGAIHSEKYGPEGSVFWAARKN